MPLTLKAARNPRFGDASKSFIYVECEFEELVALGTIPFMASLRDVETHGREIFRRCLAGEFGEVGSPPPDNTQPKQF